MAKKKYVISKKRLKDFYHKQKLSIFKIAEIFSCTAGTIINRMKEYNIKRRHSGPKRINISKQVLYTLYIKRKLSSRKIAKICHCDQTPILNRLRKYNIPVRRPKRKVIVSKKELKKLYVEQKLSTYKIGKIFHCSHSVILRNLKAYKIKTRPLKKIRITKNQLENLYIKKKFSLSKIANLYKCCPTVILDKMRKYRIPRRSISETSTRHIKKNFDGNQVMKAYMIGFRIGDLGVGKDFNLINIGCGTTKLEQIQLIKSLFSSYGPVWISKKNKEGAVHVDCSLNSSFKFLLPKHNSIPKWIFMSNRNFFSFLAGYTDAEGNIGISQGRAKFRLRSYDKEILRNINDKLHKIGIKSLFRLDWKAGINKRGILQSEDSWAAIVNERASLLKLLRNLKPLIKHKKRKRDLIKALKNVISRLKN